MQLFRHFWAKNGYFQDKKPIYQLVLEQFHRISALQITGYSSSMSLYVGIPKNYHSSNIFSPKRPSFEGFGALYAGYAAYFV